MRVFLLLVTVAALLGQTPEPKRYECHRAAHPIQVDGRLNDAAWQRAAWTDDFIDIVGPAKPGPRFRSRAKLLWDETYLYIGAELEEPDVSATLTTHDSVIFHDNDFEVFLKPPGGGKSYFEFEINALNTSWDLFLPKPYREGGKADNTWDIPGLKTAVAIDGSLNNPKDRDTGWTVEIAIPWKAFASRVPLSSPVTGDEWRLNFSRVEWRYRHVDGQYVKVPATPEDNWVWSPQYVVNMHVPDRWGYLRLAE